MKQNSPVARSVGFDNRLQNTVFFLTISANLVYGTDNLPNSGWVESWFFLVAGRVLRNSSSGVNLATADNILDENHSGKGSLTENFLDHV